MTLPDMTEPPVRRRRRRIRAWWEGAERGDRIAVAVPLAVAALGGAFALAAALVPVAFGEKKAEDAQMAIVDIGFVESDEKGQTLDIKVRNKGTSVAFVKRVDVLIRDWRPLKVCGSPHTVTSSYTYKVRLPLHPKRLPAETGTSVSQAIEPDKVDRFSVKLGTKGEPEYREVGAIYNFTVRLAYNEGSENVVSEPLTTYVEYPVDIDGLTRSGSAEESACVDENIAAVRHMADLPGRKSEYVSDLEEQVEKG